MARAPEKSQPEEIEIGAVFASRYRVVERLGSGSTATVYKVQDLLANDILALKVLRPLAAQDPKVILRFKREVAMTRKLSHVNVVSVFDLGVHYGLYYILMEYVEGRSLARYLAEVGHLALPEFLTLFDEFCKALAWVHSNNIIHRDIKPSNVMFTPAWGLKLMDFGIAKELTGGLGHSTMIGTQGYVAPEQQMGLPVGPTADIYSAGAMFYELLTGKRVQGEGPPASFPDELRQAAPELPLIIAKCMEVFPGNRYQTVAELKAAAARIQRRFSPASHGRVRLIEKMTEEPGDPREVIPLLLRVVNRVDEIHQAGRYHPELSPRNIWVTSTGGVEIDDCDTPRAQGTLGPSDAKYLAPEVFADAAESGPHSCTSRDTYVLGFSFYEMLLGQQAFQKQFRRQAVGRGDRDWLTWHGDPKKSLAPIGEILADCPKPLAALIEKMASKNAAERPGNLEDVSAELLKLHLSTEQTAPLAPPPPVPPMAQPATRGGVFRWLGSAVPTLFRIVFNAIRGASGVSFLARLARVAAILLPAALLVGAALYVAHERNSEPVSFRVEPNALIILDRSGSELWRKTLEDPVEAVPDSVRGVDAPAPRVWFGDLDGDGHTETLFLFRPRNPGHLSSVFCFSERGEERWRFVPGRTVASAKQAFPPPYQVSQFLVAPVGPNGRQSVIVSSVHFQDYPSQVVLLSAQGEMLAEYWHSGHLSRIVSGDLDHDGTSEIYLGGMSAARDCATLVALDASHFAGASDEKAAPDYQLRNLPPGTERARVFFPRSTMYRRASATVGAMQVEGDSLLVPVLAALQGGRTVVNFRLGPDLALRKIELPDDTSRISAGDEAALRQIVVLR